MNFELLIGPIVGGIIGYITNGIAIKMLFRPLKPIYLFGIKLPFTPGIIPKEKGRVAKSIGAVVARELINEEVLSKVLLQENVYDHIDAKLGSLINQCEEDEWTVKETGEKLFGEEELEKLTQQVKRAAARKAYNKVLQLDLGKMAAQHLVNEVKNGFDRSIFGAFSFFINDSMIENIAEKLEPIINKVVAENGEDIITELIQKEMQELLYQPIGAFKIKENSDMLKGAVKKLYTHFVQHDLSKALQVIDLSKVVEDRINAFDTLELERVILEIAAKELNAIIWLGALLGAILGCIMSIV